MSKHILAHRGIDSPVEGSGTTSRRPGPTLHEWSDPSVEQEKLNDIELVEAAEIAEVGPENGREESGVLTVEKREEAQFRDGRISFAQKVIGERYKVLDVIGQGGMGSVYKVEDPSGHVFALKLLKPELCQDRSVLRRFEQEAASLSELQHENIVAVYDHGITNDGAPYLVMPYLQGGTLSELLAREEKIEPTQAVSLMLQICAGLSQAHEQKIIHRDLKPGNLILSNAMESDPTVQIVDFGIAKVLETTAGNTTNLTQTGDVFGTTAYMSPEQCQGGDIDYRSDIYSLGCIFYQMITGKPPFSGANAVQVAVKQVSGEVERFASKYPDGHILVSLEQIVQKCMQKDKTDRYQSVNDLIADLKLTQSGKEIAYEEHSGAKAGPLKRAAKRVAEAGNALFISFWYLIFSIMLFAGDSNTSGSITFVAVVGLIFQIKFLVQFFRQLKKRRAVWFWSEHLLMISLLASYALCALNGIAEKPQIVTDTVTMLFLISLTSSVFLLWSSAVVCVALPAMNRGLHFVHNLNNRTKTPVEKAIPLSFPRAAGRLFSTASVLFLIFLLVAVQTKNLTELASGFGNVCNRFESTLAKPFYEFSIGVAPDDRAYRGLARCYEEHGNPEAALKSIEQGLSAIPNDHNLIVARGETRRRLRQYAQTVKELSNALRVHDEAEILVERGRAFLGLGDYARAQDDFTRAQSFGEDSDREDSSENVDSLKGLAFLGQGKLNEAVDEFNVAIERTEGGDRTKHYVRRGIAYQLSGNEKTALDDFKEAIKTSNSSTGEGDLILAFAAKKAGDDVQYGKALAAAERKGVSRDRLGQVLLDDIRIPLSW
ncbi:MAG: protein kinase [Cyanobacteria bacterium]|nr:protein kinase [Cyanobacteriota bacterium]